MLHSHDRENPGKFDAKSDEEIFLGYSTNSRAYRVYNKRTKTVMESINVVIDNTISEKDIDDDGEGPNLKKNEVMETCLNVMILRKNHWKRSLHLLYQEERLDQHKDLQAHSPLRKFNLQFLVMRNLPLPRDHRKR